MSSSAQEITRCAIEITVTNFIVEPSNIYGDYLLLSGNEAKHLTKTLRAKAGDVFYAIDGSGKKYRAVIESIKGPDVKAIISNITRHENEPVCDLTLAMGVCRPAKMDDIVEKGTEIGVSSFLFYYSEKSYAKMKDEPSVSRKLPRLKRIATAAAKQSKRSFIPVITGFQRFSDTIKLVSEYDISFLAESRNVATTIDEVTETSSDIKKVLLMVGPESGLSDDEFNAAIETGFLPVTLGPRRLRAETAGIIFPALILNRMGDL